MNHFVYYLYTAEGELVYVGRSAKPRVRLKCAEGRYGMRLGMHVSTPLSLEEALEKEVSDIKKFSPRLNKYITNQGGKVGMVHSRTTRLKLSRVPRTEEWKSRITEAAKERCITHAELQALKVAAMNVAVRGKKQTPTHVAKRTNGLSALKQGVPLRESTKEAMRAAWARRRALGLPTGAQCWRGKKAK
jgi:hypothetical protein